MSEVNDLTLTGMPDDDDLRQSAVRNNVLNKVGSYITDFSDLTVTKKQETSNDYNVTVKVGEVEETKTITVTFN